MTCVGWPVLNCRVAADGQVTSPMDLNTMQLKASCGHYSSVPEFQADMILMRENCRLFNEDSKGA